MLITNNSIPIQLETQSCQAAETAKLVDIKIEHNSSHLAKAQIEISNLVTHPVYNEIIKLFRCRHLDGFLQKDVPLDYLEETYNQEIKQKLKSYLFSHVVVDHLINELMAKKIPYSNYPRLTNIKTSNENDISFFFDLSLTEPVELKEWKNFAFKSPKRKRYKDLDKQVKIFLETQTHTNQHSHEGIVEECDWVHFSATLLDENQKPIFQQLTSDFWIKMQRSELSNKFKSIFLGKKQGDSFITNELNFEDPSDTSNGADPIFLIIIRSVIKGQSLSLELFKHTFKLKNKTDLHNKMMEVFSYRNDMSQRKTIIEEVFNLLLSKHRFEVPKHLVLRRQEDILLNLMAQPDYHVYKAQKDFLKCTELLAEKNLKEETIIDQIAYKENVKVDSIDIQDYLNLLNNKRMSEFAYFRPTLEKIEDLHSPLNQGIIVHTALREKALNHVIYSLTK